MESVHRRVAFPVKNGVYKGKGLDLSAEAPRVKLR